MVKLEKEDCWGILNGKFNLREVMKKFGINETKVDESLEKIKQADRHDSSNYFGVENIFIREAYLRLVYMKEIDDTKIYNLASKKYDDGVARIGDMGLMGEKNYCYAADGWEFSF